LYRVEPPLKSTSFQTVCVHPPLWKERWIFMPGWGVKFTHGCFL
jgi:hypothetical protein